MERIQSASETGGTSDGIAPIPSTDQTYTAEDILRTMPMQEYLAGYRDFGRVRGYCHGCSRFGTCWACPPYSFDEEQCLRRYGTIDLLATRITPAEGIVLTREVSEEIIRKERRRLDAMLLRREREAGLDESGSNLQARAFFAGTCLLCPPEQCTRRCNAPCRHPESIRPSLEAMGFDISRTASGIFGIPLQWASDGNPPAYLTLVSGLAY